MCLLFLILFLQSTLWAGVSTANAGIFYEFGSQEQQHSADSFVVKQADQRVGLMLALSSYSESNDHFGVHYSLRAATTTHLKSDSIATKNLQDFALDLAIGFALQHPLSYRSFVEGGIGVRIAAISRSFDHNSDAMIEQVLSLGPAAFAHYSWAVHNNMVVQVGAQVHLPIFGVGRLGKRGAPHEGKLTISGFEVAPYAGVAYVF